MVVVVVVRHRPLSRSNLCVKLGREVQTSGGLQEKALSCQRFSLHLHRREVRPSRSARDMLSFVSTYSGRHQPRHLFEGSFALSALCFHIRDR